MKKFLNLALLALTISGVVSQNAEALSPPPPVAVLAEIEQYPGYMMPSPEKNYLGRTIQIQEDGVVVVLTRYSIRGRQTVEVTRPLLYKAEDMLRYKKSIAQLKFDRPLIEDTESPVMCDGGTTHFKVTLKEELVTLFEANDCRNNRLRQNRSWLEVEVIKVMEDLLEALNKLDI